MKILHVFLVSVISAVLVAACQGGNNTAAMATQSLMRTDSAFSTMSERQGFAAAFRQYATDDALLLPENRAALKGRTAIVDSLQGLPAGSTLSWSPQGADVSADLGYTRGVYSLIGKNGAGQATAAYGNYLSVWKKQAGDWRLAVMMVNSTPGPAGG